MRAAVRAVAAATQRLAQQGDRAMQRNTQSGRSAHAGHYRRRQHVQAERQVDRGRVGDEFTQAGFDRGVPRVHVEHDLRAVCGGALQQRRSIFGLGGAGARRMSRCASKLMMPRRSSRAWRCSARSIPWYAPHAIS